MTAVEPDDADRPPHPRRAAQSAKEHIRSAVLYVNTTASGDVESSQALIEAYAREHNLLIVARYLDREGAAPPEEKAGLQSAINAVRSGRATHLLVVDHSAISPLRREFDAVRAHVLRARGVVTAVGWPAVDPAAWGAAIPYRGSGRPIGL